MGVRKRFTFRLDSELYALMVAHAKKRDMSWGSFVKLCIIEFVERHP